MIVNIISRNSPDNHYHESNNSFQPPARFPIANFRKFALVLRIGVPDVIVTMPTTHLFHEMMGYFNLVNTSHCHVSNSFNPTIHTLPHHHHNHHLVQASTRHLLPVLGVGQGLDIVLVGPQRGHAESLVGIPHLDRGVTAG